MGKSRIEIGVDVDYKGKGDIKAAAREIDDMGKAANRAELEMAALKVQQSDLLKKTNELATSVARGQKSFDAAERELRQYKAEMTKLPGPTDQAAKKTSLLQSAIGKLAVAGGIAAATRQLVQFGKESLELANIQQKAEAQLAQVIKSTGGAAGLSADQLKAYASELQSLTTFGDEAIIGAQSLLLTFTNIGKDVFPQATATVLDMSQALGQDLKSSSIQLGKALNDPITGVSALQRVGVSFSQSQKDVIRSLAETGDVAGAQAIILEELNRQFGGSAAAAADTYAGKMQQLSNTWGDSKEQIGFLVQELTSDFIPALSTGAAAVGEMVSTMVDAVREGREFREATADGGAELLQNAAAAAVYETKLAELSQTGQGHLTTTQKQEIALQAAFRAMEISTARAKEMGEFYQSQLTPSIEENTDSLRTVNRILLEHGANLGMTSREAEELAFATGELPGHQEDLARAIDQSNERLEAQAEVTRRNADAFNALGSQIDAARGPIGELIAAQEELAGASGAAAEEAQGRILAANEAISESYRQTALDILKANLAEAYGEDALGAQLAAIQQAEALGLISQAQAELEADVAVKADKVREVTGTMFDEFLADGVLTREESEAVANAIGLIESGAISSGEAIQILAENGVDAFGELSEKSGELTDGLGTVSDAAKLASDDIENIKTNVVVTITTDLSGFRIPNVGDTEVTIPITTPGRLGGETMAHGGFITGGVAGRDSVPIMAMPGEYVIRKSAVDRVGLAFMNALNSGTLQGMAHGGPVTNTNMSNNFNFYGFGDTGRSGIEAAVRRGQRETLRQAGLSRYV